MSRDPPESEADDVLELLRTVASDRSISVSRQHYCCHVCSGIRSEPGKEKGA